MQAALHDDDDDADFKRKFILGRTVKLPRNQ